MKLKHYLRLLAVLLFSAVVCHAQAAKNDLQKTSDGGFPQKWLISNGFPAEIDAGMWENFNRFNIEALPRKDWLAPFGSVSGINPRPGKFPATMKPGDSSQPAFQNPKLRADLPEVGEVSNSKPLPDATEIEWREVTSNDARLDLFALNGSKNIGTSYAAAYIDSALAEERFIETDGFLGAVWLNGEKIYDGYTLNVRKTGTAKFRAGQNLLIVRATGISGDYWRKDGGWTAQIRFWKNSTDAQNAAAFKPSGKRGTIFYLEGFHVDPVYLQDQRGYSKVTLANVNQYISSLRADPRYGVFLSEIDYLKPYLDTHPEDRDFLRQAVADGRVGTGGAYNQPNPMNTGGEAFIRNILYGQEMHQAMLGRKAESIALWDVFGHPPQLTQIAQKSGFTGVVWSKKITGFQPLFYDYALDGSRMLHRRIDYAYSFSGFGSGKNYSFDNFRRMTERKFEEAQSNGSSYDLRINAADFTPPWTNLAGNIDKLSSSQPEVKVTGQAQDLFFRAINKEIKEGKINPPISSRDKLFFHVGVMMARSDLKVAHRKAENTTLTAEKFGSIAYLLGAKYPDLALDKAWRQIFFGSHHDAITGTPSDSAFLDLVHGYREAFELSSGALNDSLKFIAKQINTKAGSKNAKAVPIVVFNPMNWKRNDVVQVAINGDGFILRDAKGQIVPHKNLGNGKIEFLATDVPSVGYKTYYAEAVNSRPQAFGNPSATVLENEFYKVTIDPSKGGAISSIYDKQAAREVVKTSDGHFGNEIASLKEELTRKNVIYPAWEMWTTGEKRFSTEKWAKIVSSNPEEIVVEGELPNMQKFRQTISLRRGIKRIDFKTELIGYKGYNELFTVNFPLNLSGCALVTEDRFGTVVRNGSKGFLDFRTNTDKLVSGAPVYGTNNWAEYGSVLNLNFTDAKGIAASVPFKPAALVRPQGAAFESATETLVSTLIKRGVSITPFYDDFEIERRKNLTIEDSTMPKKLNDDIAYHNFRIALGDEKQNKYTADLIKIVSAETKAKFDARLTKDGFAYIFLYDKNVPEGWQPMPVLLIAGDVKRATENLLSPLGKGEFALNILADSFAVETNPNKELPKVSDYGVALINGGTPAVSLENPNTLTLHLTHTALFPGINLPFEFVPENKTHVFTYALYPHAKDWREADTVKAGYEFNNPLMAVQTDLHEGNLPGEKSFISNDSDKFGNIVLTTLKVGENPQASFQTSKLANLRSFVLRFNETEGRARTPNVFTFSPRQPSKDDSRFYDVYWNLKPTDLLEREIKDAKGERNTDTASAQFRQGIDGFAIETYSIKRDGQIEKKDACVGEEIGATKEPVQPVFSKYWMHNMGAAPIGNDAVKVSLRPLEQMGNLSTFSWDDPYNQGGITTNAVRVQVVNNYQDRKVSGEIELEAPADWRIVPDKIPYEIEPNGSFVKDVAVIAFPVKKNEDWERASGLIKARINHDGQTFQDVLQIGKPYKLTWKVEKSSEGTLVHIKNPYRQNIEGAVAMIRPPEEWMMDIVATESPRELGFLVPARGETTLKFPKASSNESWSIARIAYNGWVEYLRADDYPVTPIKK